MFQTPPPLWPAPMPPPVVDLGRALIERHPALGARDLLHLACCERRGVARVRTYDRALATAFPHAG